MPGKIFFALQYWVKNPPWDTGITPPEVYSFLEGHPPGRALDLGCGTGTNVITLASQGWQVEGVDFIPLAIRKARRKARLAGVGDRTAFFAGDVLSPDSFRGAYDLILDIGCFHVFPESAAGSYGRNLRDHLVPGGSYLLYAHLNPEGGWGHGATEASLDVLGEFLTLVNRVDGEESSRPSAWLEFRKA